MDRRDVGHDGRKRLRAVDSGISVLKTADYMIGYGPLFDHSPNAYVVLDPALRIVQMNRAYLRVTMREREELLGRNMFEAFPSDETSESHRALKESLARVLATGETDALAHIRYDIPNPDGSIANEYWSATHTPILSEDGKVAFILQHTVNITKLGHAARSGDEAGIVERAQFVQRRASDMARETEQLRNLLEQTPGFMAFITGPDHRFTMTNAAYRRLLGDRPLAGRTVAEAIPEVVDQGFVASLDQVLATGRPYFGKREKVIFHNEGARPRETYLEFIFQPVRDSDNELWGIFIQGHDVTEEVEAEERQRLLINELNHRVKNTLAVVQGLAQQSFGKREGAQFEIFAARLAALAGAHNLLTAATWESADLRELIHSALEATAGMDIARCDLAGGRVTVPPGLALSLVMIMHELSTNAIKYGSLSRPGGRVGVRWSNPEDTTGSTLVIEWEETGGPVVSRPPHEGFGTRLIRRGLSGQGTTELDYRPAGLWCRIEAQL